MTVTSLPFDLFDFAIRSANGIIDYVDEETGPVYSIDYEDALEDGLKDENLSYTEEQKEQMLDMIRSVLEARYGYDNVYYGGFEQSIPIDGQFKSYYGQLAIKITEYSKLSIGNSTIVKFEGKEYRSIQDPYINDDGTAYKAHAVDQHDNEYMIEWEVVYPDHENGDDGCLWESPVKVEKI